MNHVMNTNILEKPMAKNHSLLREIDDSLAELFPVLYMYGDIQKGLSGSLSIMDNHEFASIEALRNEIKEQRKIFQKNRSDVDEGHFDSLSPWMLKDSDEYRLIVCKEGVFEWSWQKEEYELVGTVRRLDRQKRIIILEDSEVIIAGKSIELKEGSSFPLDNEYVVYDHLNKPIIMLVVYLKSVPIAISYDSNLMDIRDQDFAGIDFIMN